MKVGKSTYYWSYKGSVKYSGTYSLKVGNRQMFSYTH